MPLGRIEVAVTGFRRSRRKTLALSLCALQLSLRQRYIHDSPRFSICKNFFNVPFQGALLDTEVFKSLHLVRDILHD
jgi:hypothetical protein